MKEKVKKGTDKTEWDLGLLYSGTEDPKIEKDVTFFETKVAQFENTYRPQTKRFSDPKFLAKALEEYETLSTMPEVSRPGFYFSLRRELAADDVEAEKKLNLLEERLTRAGNKLLFFDLALGKLSKVEQEKLLKSPILADYNYHLTRIFLTAQHDLSEPEEKILNLKSNTSYSLWVSATEKMLNRKMVKMGKKQIPLAEAFEQVAHLKKAERRKLWSAAMEICKELGEVAENELTAIVLHKKVNDELRKFPQPESATILGYENDQKAIDTLIETVTESFPIAHRFYKLKAKMLKEKQLLYADRSAEVGKEPKVTFGEASAILREAFYGLKTEYGAILDSMLKNGQIDAFPKKGKTGGAFCAGVEHLPTFVLLNFIPNMKSLMTFAHEMGHAIHTERAKTQRPLYQGYSTATAETASTFFENVLFEKQLEKLNKKERIIALHNKISDDIASIMRQVAFFNFEKEMHERIRKEGALTREELAVLMQKHLQSYLGPAVKVTKDDGYTFVYVSHFRRFFYVYTYAYGNTISNLLAQRVARDPEFIHEVDSFLTAGSSQSPEEIFKSIGVNTMNPSFFREGMKALDARIDELSALTGIKV